MKVTMNPILLLVLGVVLMLASHMTLSIALFAWVAYVPFLLYLHRTTGWKSRLGFFLAYLIAWSLIVGKITTAPLSVAMIPLFSLPISFFHLPAFLLWARWRHRKGGHLLFPAVMVVMEWVQYTFTPFASWGVAAYTQMDQVGLMQSVSLFGMGGLSFLIYWINVELAQFLSQKEAQVRRLMIPAMVLAGVMVFGAIRYDVGKMKGTNTIKVAAVGTDSQVDGSSLPPDEIRQANAARLFARTRQAALDHAKLIVWNEGAAAVLPEEEEAWKDSLSHLAQSCQASLVAAYVVQLSLTPVRYENKYQFFLADGSLAATYYKHEPVPGEPAIKGTSPFVAHEIQGLKVGGAICYDYDFPLYRPWIGKARG
jgi:apolipoprotein N-acyltransferase